MATRKIYDLKTKTELNYQELDRESLGVGVMLGPIVVAEAQTTTLVRSGWTVKNINFGHLVLDRIIA